MELKPNSGIGNLVFGQSEYDVKQILGFPDIIDESWENENELVYQYYKYKICLYFYLNERGKLGYIKCSNSDLRYHNKKIIGQNISIIKDTLFQCKNTNWEEEHYEFHQTHFSVKHWITLVVKYNKVIELEAGIPYLCKNKHNWGKALEQPEIYKSLLI